MTAETAMIILAAGLGTRMKSTKAKVLHQLGGKPMVHYILETARKMAAGRIVLVIGNQAEDVRRVVCSHFDGITFALQKEQRGTGHAVACGLPHVPAEIETVMILYADVPLLSVNTLTRLWQDHTNADRDVTLLAVEAENPTGYGRILTDSNNCMVGIVEEADADRQQKAITIINSGIYCVRRSFLSAALEKLEPKNAQGELYLTDIIAIGHRQGAKLGFIMGSDFDEIVGVNTLADLKRAEALLERRHAEIT